LVLYAAKRSKIHGGIRTAFQRRFITKRGPRPLPPTLYTSGRRKTCAV